ncbi:MAG: outer membrane beta-barrel protein [Saonia sp.]
MRYVCPVIFLMLIGTMGFSQDVMITGKVMDSETKQPLEAATIYVETLRDSTLLSYTVSDREGQFELELNTKYTKVNFFITYYGYTTFKKQLELSTTRIDLAELALQTEAQQLRGVKVVGERVPISIKKDTVTFNANSFNTRPDATVEDLLKRLPGIAIAGDGKITVNGIAVDRLFVNGQAFFSDDPNIATKGLTKEIIGQVQITGTKTTTEEFTGEQGTKGTKTINLILKEDRNKGYLGRLSAGYGTDERYQTNGLLNYFNNAQRISVLASSNNVNNPGFSFDEISDMAGGARNLIPSSGNGQGITTSSSLGTSYANTQQNTYEIAGDYFLAYSDSFDDQKTARENVLPDGRFFTDTDSRMENSNILHRASANLRFDIDKTLRVSMTPFVNATRTNSLNSTSTVSTDQNGNRINENETWTVGKGSQRNFSNRLDILKKLGAKGKFIGLSFSNNNTINTDITDFNSQRAVFGDDANEEILDQRIDTDNSNDTYEVRATYRQPIRENLFLDLEYSFLNNSQTNVRSVFDFNENTGDNTDLNETLSSDFSFSNNQQSPAVSVRQNGEKLQAGITAKYIFTDLDNRDFLQETSFSKTYKNVLLSAFANYSLGKNKTIGLGYNTVLGIPTIDQLRPVPNLNDPLNIIIGNPDLNPTVSHGINFNYNNYNWKERTGIFLYAGGEIQQDKVVAVTATDENFLRTTTYTNVDGNYNGSLGVIYSKQIKKDSTVSATMNLGSSFDYRRDVSFNNDQKLIANSYGLGPRLSGILNVGELLEVEPGYVLSFNASTYNVDSFEDIDFVSHLGSLRTTLYWPKNVVWSSDVNYTYNNNLGPGFDKDAFFWNMSLGLQLFNRKSMLKVLVYDLLNQNINTRRTTGLDFVQDFQGTVLRQYFMVSFSYNFNQFGTKM